MEHSSNTIRANRRKVGSQRDKHARGLQHCQSALSKFGRCASDLLARSVDQVRCAEREGGEEPFAAVRHAANRLLTLEDERGQRIKELRGAIDELHQQVRGFDQSTAAERTKTQMVALTNQVSNLPANRNAMSAPASLLGLGVVRAGPWGGGKVAPSRQPVAPWKLGRRTECPRLMD